MGLIPAATFERELGRLDREASAAFVADLYAARGLDATAADGIVRIARDEGVESLTVVSSGRFRPGSRTGAAADVDGVVATCAGIGPSDTDGRYVSPDELHRALLYGVDRADADWLTRQYLGRPLRVTDDDPDTAGTSRVGVLAAAVLLIVASTAAGFPLLHQSGTGEGQPAGATPAETSADAGPAGGGATNGTSGDTYPAGVTADGVVDAAALAIAHRNALGDRSYRVVLRGQGRIAPIDRPLRDGVTAREWDTFSQRVSVERPGVYRSRVTATPALGASFAPTYARDDYGDGAATYRRNSTGETTFRLVDRSSRAVSLGLATTIERYLATTASSVDRLDDGRFRVVATGTPVFIDRPVRAYRAVAVVDRAGVVRDLEVRYRDPTADGDGQSEVIYLTVDRLDEERVDRPHWYEQARSATGTAAHPAGIDPDAGTLGTVNAIALANTHRAALRDRSYRWAVELDGPSSIPPRERRLQSTNRSLTVETSYVNRTAAVEGPRRYRERSFRVFTPANDSFPSVVEAYADGDAEYRRAGTTRFEDSPLTPSAYARSPLPAGTRDPFVGTAERFIRRYLSTDEVMVLTVESNATDGPAGDPIRYRVLATDRPEEFGPDVQEFWAAANVTESGLVRDLTVEYVLFADGGATRVRFEQRYREVGTTSVDEPTWYDRARSVTDE
jgi:hypothetical protein